MKTIVFLVLVYVAIVAAFESLIGFIQPAGDATLILTTFEPDGTAHDRVLARLDTDGKVYASANHWPRAWYRRALANPDVQATLDGRTGPYHVVSVAGAEAERVEREHPHSMWFRIVTGFPPRHFVRLDPR
ncbi:MAG: hypothetical protein IT293_20500 [Deltaproteobacteria bacterium]|nr:hypothetical protein [Deltaproteobacteria bacterium]